MPIRLNTGLEGQVRLKATVLSRSLRCRGQRRTCMLLSAGGNPKDANKSHQESPMPRGAAQRGTLEPPPNQAKPLGNKLNSI